MPQDRLRSVVYRSFLTCEDPKGVVECRTIRKSKTDSKKMETNVDTQGTQNLNTSSLKTEKRKDKVTNKGSTEELYNPSSIQLMEVSRGARKLNQVVDSLSKRTSFDDKSNGIAKDLLRGALDLQESLIMLSKLQEASQYMAKLKKKQKEKAGGGRAEQVRIERINSDSFRDYNYPMVYQKPRLSADGSSRDCYEELRKAIRDGLARQNLLPNISSEEKYCFYRKKLNLSPEISSVSSSLSSVDHSHGVSSPDCYEELRKVIRDGLARGNLLPNSSSEEKFYFDGKKLDLTLNIPSINSSRSSTDHSLEFTSPDSLSSKILQEKPRGTNLIAKLMGLEEIPPKPMQCTSPKQLERDKIFSQRRLIFDIDVPKARTPHFAVQKVDPERKTLEEIIDTVQFKGLLKSKSGDMLKHETRHSNAFDLRKRFVDDAPPIVLIKPLHVPCLEATELHTDKFIREESALDTEEKLRKWKIKEEIPPETINHQEASLNAHEILRKPEVKTTPINSVMPKKGGKDRKDVNAKPDDRKVKTKEVSSANKLKASVHVNSKLQKEEPVDKRVDKIRKETSSGRKPAETKNVKSKGVCQHPDQGKVTSTKVRMPESKSCISRIQTPQQKYTTSNSPEKRTTPTASRNSSNRKKNVTSQKPDSEPLAANVENIVCQDDNMQIDLHCENESCMTVTSTTPEVQLLTEEGTDSSEILTEETRNSSPNSLCETSLLTTLHFGEADYCITHSISETKSEENRQNPRDFLLGSAAFISHAEELFEINARKPLILQASLHDSEMVSTRILLDCADELLERKSQQSTRMTHPLLQNPVKNSSISISLYRLVDEICEEIESLRSYNRHTGGSRPVDTLNVVLESDFWCKGVVSGTWDMGWKNGFTSEEVGKVVGDIEKLVISGLIEELLIDFVL